LSMAAPLGNGTRRRLALLLLLGAAGAAACFAALGEAVGQRRTQAFDEWALRSLRTSEDPARPIGPEWVAPAAKAITFLGSWLGLVLATAGAAAFLCRGEGSLPVRVPPLRVADILSARAEGILPSSASSSSSSSAAAASAFSSSRRESRTEETAEEARGRDAHETRGQDALATQRPNARRAICLLLASLLGGLLLSETLKYAFDRPRPTVVPHLEQVLPHSFPSGHSMLSAAVYITITLLLAGRSARWPRRAGFLMAAIVVTFLVGASRVVLGVHYPTDVLGGWAGGLAWAMVCWAAALYWPIRQGQSD
jgi:membrane-associated phospholipid phosphatase